MKTFSAPPTDPKRDELDNLLHARGLDDSESVFGDDLDEAALSSGASRMSRHYPCNAEAFDGCPRVVAG